MGNAAFARVADALRKLDGAEPGSLKIRDKDGKRFSDDAEMLRRLRGQVVVHVENHNMTDHVDYYTVFSAEVRRFILVMAHSRDKDRCQLHIEFDGASIIATHWKRSHVDVCYMEAETQHHRAHVLIEVLE